MTTGFQLGLDGVRNPLLRLRNSEVHVVNEHPAMQSEPSGLTEAGNMGSVPVSLSLPCHHSCVLNPPSSFLLPFSLDYPVSLG